MGRCAASEIAKANGDAAEMESIESFHLNNPAAAIPKPPPSYFHLQSSGPPTMKKSTRSVSVTIGEYTDRKEPNKFDFIAKSPTATSDSLANPNGDVSDRLKSELENTLIRSQLKSKMHDSEVIYYDNYNKLLLNEFKNVYIIKGC